MSQLVVSSSPHLKDHVTTTTLMRDVLIALIPSGIAAGILFGFRAILLIAVCMASCVAFEYFYQKLMKQPILIHDGSAMVTGALLAFTLPADLPFWMAIIGCFIAIVIAKQLFGGLGANFANPALVARIALMLSFTEAMSPPYPIGLQHVAMTAGSADTVVGATPLGGSHIAGGTLDMFLGSIGGSLGEVCKLALLIGGIYLIVRQVITITIPLAYLGSAAIFALLFGVDPVFHLLTGGLILGAFFMATDYVTSPMTEKGKVIYGVGCGLLTMVIRVFGDLPEGVSYAILIMNLLTPLIDNALIPKALGGIENDE